MFRIGIGHDTHRLVEGRPLVLGGVRVVSELGAEGHSDADALTHAITDAILGALCAGDIGTHFPDSEPQWQGIESLRLLARVVEMATGSGYRIVNVDATVLLERPKLRSYIDGMREQLASVLEVGAGCVSVKAKTGEGLDAVGEGRAVTAQAIVLLTRAAAE
ncbi:MAG: 2-C-methyl-D-erythritol 2,4-cyclodiphosphate synthase [Pyrinomonadaceae bacterium]|nr:2-C-methyl-D-erythritol 2,4-cyclodiphosphate synthase [Pyrinomonadaceae bacterium]MDQ3135574.1 2-C-methyl-D-erythritol 2,4-cyclodiphosphate synthase [Acidobacteriota bacterium]